MPEFTLESDPEEPLFPNGDFTLTLPGTGKFRLRDRANPIRETAEFNPDSRPVSYVVESLVQQVVEEEQDRFRSKLIAALDDEKVRVKSLMDALRWITDQREKAEEDAVARQTGRPTSAPLPSTP